MERKIFKMKKILLTLIPLLILSCEKEEFAYYSIDNNCLLVKMESNLLTTKGYNFYYNSAKQVTKREPYMLNTDGSTISSSATDSVIYLNGLPFESYHQYSTSKDIGSRKNLFRHEKYSFTGSRLDSINYYVYENFSFNFLSKGVTKYIFNNSKIISSMTIEDNYKYKNYISSNYFYAENNLDRIEETSWKDPKILAEETDYLDEDTVYTTKVYSEYDDNLNPYKGLFLVYELREKCYSDNTYHNYEEIVVSSRGDTLLEQTASGIFSSYLDNNYPERDFINYLYYDCD